jgi:hypothetical protein
MQTLRNFTLLARFVLACMVLSMGVAVASPLVKPQNAVLVCTGAGVMKVLITADDGTITEQGSTTMDCPLCVAAGAPPPVVTVKAEPLQPLAYALQSIPSAHIAARTAAPLPARGPPNL